MYEREMKIERMKRKTNNLQAQHMDYYMRGEIVSVPLKTQKRKYQSCIDRLLSLTFLSFIHSFTHLFHRSSRSSLNQCLEDDDNAILYSRNM